MLSATWVSAASATVGTRPPTMAQRPSASCQMSWVSSVSGGTARTTPGRPAIVVGWSCAPAGTGRGSMLIDTTIVWKSLVPLYCSELSRPSASQGPSVYPSGTQPTVNATAGLGMGGGLATAIEVAGATV